MKGFREGPPLEARFNEPANLAISAGSAILVISESGGGRLRVLPLRQNLKRLEPGVYTSLALRKGWTFTLAGDGMLAPSGVVLRNRSVYVSDRGHQCVLAVSMAEFHPNGGTVITLAGPDPAALDLATFEAASYGGAGRTSLAEQANQRMSSGLSPNDLTTESAETASENGQNSTASVSAMLGAAQHQSWSMFALSFALFVFWRRCACSRTHRA